MDEYLYKQSISPFFHGILNMEIDYLARSYGEEALFEMFRQVTKEVYAPLINEVATRGLPAMEEHLGQVMGLEDGEYISELRDGTLIVEVSRDPAVGYLEDSGETISPFFSRIANELVNEVIAEQCGYDFSMTYGQSDQEYTQVWETRR